MLCMFDSVIVPPVLVRNTINTAKVTYEDVVMNRNTRFIYKYLIDLKLGHLILI